MRCLPSYDREMRIWKYQNYFLFCKMKTLYKLQHSKQTPISDILLETNFPSFAPNISTQKCSPTSPKRRIKKPFLHKPLLTPKTPSLKEAASSQKSSMLGGRSCSFLASNARVEQDKDRGSPVLVQCRWFDSPVPSLDKHEVSFV